MKVTFVTGNQRKLGEAKQACQPFGIEIVQRKLDIDEIQHHDPIKITQHKAKEAFRLINKPLFVNDASWNIPALQGFPGGYMKDIASWFKPEDFLALVSQKQDRRICCVETIIYKDKSIIKVINKEFWGEIANTPRGVGNSIEQVAIFNSKTIGEHRAAGQYAFDHKDYIWHDFAKWYASKA